MKRWRLVVLFLVLAPLVALSCGKKEKGPGRPVLSGGDRDRVGRELAALPAPVELTLFVDDPGRCRYCPDARQVLSEVDDLSDKVSLVVKDFAVDAREARDRGAAMVPALLFDGAAPSRLKFYGVAAGYEFPMLMDALGLVSSGQTSLMPETRQALARLRKPVNIKVMVAPS